MKKIIDSFQKFNLSDTLGINLNLGDTLMLYRPLSVREVKTSLGTVVVPSAWFFGRLKLSLEKGLVVEVLDVIHPEGIKEGETEPVKLGWHISLKTSKYVIVKSAMMLDKKVLEGVFTYAQGRGKTKLIKFGLLQK